MAGMALLLISLAAPVQAEASTQSSQQCQTIHVVQRGETLHQIAQRYGTTWPVLAQVNRLPNPDQIYAGQHLCIPYTSGGNPVGTTVNCYYLNVRSGPGVGHSVVEVIRCGTQVQLLGRNSAGSWLNVRTASGRIGWVNASYIASNVPIGSLPVTW
jgi:uncharacterized protein YgiM (DUF1202 family)